MTKDSTDAEQAKRRREYRASHDAQRRAADDPELMALLRKKLAELDRQYKPADA